MKSANPKSRRLAEGIASRKAAQPKEEQVLRKTAGTPHSLIWTTVDDQVVPELVLPANAMV